MSLVARLREVAHLLGDHRTEPVVDHPLLCEAAERIEELEREVRQGEEEFDAHMEEDHDLAAAIAAGSNEMLKWALTPAGYYRFWGPELERLGTVVDEIRAENVRLGGTAGLARRWKT